jgi:tRNA pseudouridine55 synthase
VEREARPITVYELDLLEFSGDNMVLDIHISKGTYIRTNTSISGRAAGLWRSRHPCTAVKSPVYPAERMLTQEQLQTFFEHCKAEGRPPLEELDPLLLPMDTAVENLPEVNMSTVVASYVNQGQAVQVPNVPRDGFVRMTVVEAREFIGVGEI